MDFTVGQYVQLIAALFGGIALFVAVYRLPISATIAFLLVTIPIQFVDSRFGTSNTILTYLIAFAFLLQQRLRYAPMMLPIILLLFAYALSFSISHHAARLHHLLYIIGFFSNILIFYLIYNFVVMTGNWKAVLKFLIYMNVVVAVACLLEIALGQGQFRLFGLEEWAINAARAHKGRLVGPFGSTHTTSDYFVTQSVLLAFALIYATSSRSKVAISVLLAANCMAIVATGDRGGFVGLIVGAVLFLAVFRKTIGVARSIRLGLAGILLLVAGSTLVITFTDFSVLFERLEETTVETGLADARGRGFRKGLSYFEESPILGLGPDLAVSTKGRLVGDIPYRPYPHILVMHILGTLGIVGLIAWITLFSAIVGSLLSSLRRNCPDEMLSKIPMLGLLLIALFLAGELRIEFLRESFLDYQNYMFALFGWLVACAHRNKKLSFTEH